VRRSEYKQKVRDASDTELQTLLKQERENLYKMRQQIALKQLDNPHAITNAKRNVARILEEIRAREIRVAEGS